MSVGVRGDYRREGRRHGAPPPWHPASFRSASADGRWAFQLSGGARTPHRATGILSDARTHRVLKRAPVEYDEHVAFSGWVGQSIVLEIRVDEGPGCELEALDPQAAWPAQRTWNSVDLGGCFGGIRVLQPSDRTFAIVDAQGGGVVFVDEPTVAVKRLATDRVPELESAPPVAMWTEGSAILVEAYGPPWTGDVVRIDLEGEAIASDSRLPVCPP